MFTELGHFKKFNILKNDSIKLYSNTSNNDHVNS